MVEAAGIEPASEKVRTEASTRLVRSFDLADHPPGGRLIIGQPVIFIRLLRALPPD